MLPIRLKMRAFGPYAKEQVIDFTQFQSLFLIEGETGSGKTVIFDAMVYALYGKSSGGLRGDFESMRCRFAKDSDPTEVEFIFQLKQNIYRFYRRIEVKVNRAGKKVWKTSVEAGTYENEQFLPFFENCKLKNVEEKANELLHLSYDQFLQVLLLPQGKFEKFLVSKSEEKQEIMKTLFPVEQWERVVEYLQKKANERKQQRDFEQQKLEQKLKQHGCKESSELQELRNQQLLRQKEVEKEEKKQQKRIEELQEQYAKQKQVEQLFLEKEECEKQLRKWEEKRIWREAQELLIKKQEQQKQLYPYWNMKETAFSQWISIQNKKEQQKASFVEKQNAYEQLEELQKEQEIKNQEMQEKQRQKHQLEQKKDVYLQVKQLNDTYERKQKEEKSLQTTMQKQQGRWDELIDQQIKKQNQFDGLAHVEEALAKQKELCMKYDLAKQREGQKMTLLHQQEEVLMNKNKHALLLIQKQEEWEQQKQKEQNLYELFLQDSSAKLASQLKQGEPCPVCGSYDHPKPALLQEVYVDLQQLKQLRKQSEEKEQEVKQLQLLIGNEEKEFELLKHSIQQVKEEQKLLLNEAYDEKVHQKLRQELQNWNKQKQIKDDLSKQMKQLEEQKEQLAKEIKLQEEKHQLKLQEILQIEAKKQACMAQMDTRYPSVEQWENAYQQLQEEIQNRQQWLQQQQQYMQTIYVAYEKGKQELELLEEQEKEQKENYDLLKKQYEEQAKQLNWQEEKVNDIKEQDLLALKQQVEEYDRTFHEATIRFQQLNGMLSDAKRCSLNDMQQKLQENIEKGEELRYRVSMEQVAFQRYEQDGKEVQQIEESLSSSFEADHRLFVFAKAMRGDHHIGIERYVLGVMLSRITQVANDLLKYVHDGRYRLYRSDDVTGKTRKFGLELSVYDSYSGSERTAASLSGGEKFLVSLSLSLALASVVQAQNGGVTMEAMFIDEGFGTLDERSIEDALQVLNSMGTTRKMTGIISHVEMLKQNIPNGIKVHKGREGSQITVRGVCV